MRNKKLYKKDRRGIIVSLLIFSFVLMLSVGYSALNEELTISGEAHFRAQSDIRITDVSLYITSNNGAEDYNSTYGKDSMKAGVTLPSNNSSVTYKVTVTNYSNIPMQLKTIEKEIENNNYVVTFNKTLPLTIGKLSSEEIEITFKNNTSSSQTINANLLFTFAKEEAVMAMGNRKSNTFYNGPLTKGSIESITFIPTKEIPEDAVGYWDASAVQGTNKVMAYYLNSETEGMYDLYIAADGEVYAPTNSSSLFEGFTNVTNINFNDSFNTEKSTNMEHLFNGCRKLNNLDLSGFDTSNVSKMGKMFYLCTSLTNLDLSGFNTSNLLSIYTTEYGGMFESCTALANLNLTNFNTSKITNMSYMFNNCKSLKKIDLSGFNTSNLTNITSMFNVCTSLSDLNLSGWTNNKLTSMASMFSGLTNLETLNLTNFKTDSVTNMTSMFYNCKKIVNLDLSSFDMSSVKNFDQFMYGCTNLSSLIFPDEINTSSAESFYRMFYGCRYLSSLDLSKFNTSNATNMKQMFYYCERLSNLNVSNFDTGKVTNMSEMFALCYALKELDLSSFTISDNTNISYLFQADRNLKNINISGMNFENKTITTTNMFAGVPSGINIYVLNDYNKTFIEGLNSNANVIIYVSPEEEVEEG